jgi:Ca-activated chloride channel family protein
MDTLLLWLREQGVEFRVPQLLWGLLLTPLLLVFYAWARTQRRRVAGAFRIAGARGRARPRATFGRTLAVTLLLLGLAGLVVGFARPVVPLETPNDLATVVIVVDASTAMRATDVSPTRFDAARAAARAAAAALPDRVQVAVVGYSQTAYLLLPPTRDHGAVPPALGRLRTASDAATGDAIAVAVAAVPQLQEQSGAQGAQGGSASPPSPQSPGNAPPPKAPAAIILIASGDTTTGRPLPDALRSAAEAGIPVHTVPIGPRPGAEQRAPYQPDVLRQIAQATGGRTLTAPSGNTWRDLFRGLGSAVIVEVEPQEVGHYVGAGALAVIALAMLLSLLATRRLI